jgi:arabinan endo-1,5-alpha-L-arabinosidase
VNFAFIGYATSDSAGGPREDKGMITTSYRDTINTIDPTVVYDSVSRRLWMAYGSWERGIHILELDTATGGIKTPGDKGVKIARRKTTAAGLEGAEISYRNGWYYLFVSYDPLGDLYNVRVGRSGNANGPYYDFNGVDMAELSSNIPMIQAPYRFNNHFGWQGTGHCGV